MHGQRGVKNRKCMMSGKFHFPGFTKVYISLDSIWMGLLLDMNIHLKHSETRFGLLFLQLNISDWKWLYFINLHHIPATLSWADPCWADLGLDLTLELFFFVQVKWRSGLADKHTALCRTFQAWLTTGITVVVGTELWDDTARQPSHLSLNLACMFHSGGSWATALHWMGLAWTLQTIALASVPSPIKPVSNLLIIL